MPNSASASNFEHLAEQSRPMLADYLRALLRDAHLADDITQETLITAHKIFDRFDPGQSFDAWVRGIARNKIREHRRSTARRPLVIDSRIVDGMEEVLSLFDSPAQNNEQPSQQIETLRNCIGKLKRNMRAAIDSVYAGDRSLKEAAENLSSTPAAVGQRLSRARTLIRKCVNKTLPNNV